MWATSSGSPKILISCINIVYLYGSLRQGIGPFHFPVVIQFYRLAFAILGIYQFLTSQLGPYHFYQSHSLWPFPWANDFNHQLLFLTALYHQLLNYILICSIWLCLKWSEEFLLPSAPKSISNMLNSSPSPSTVEIWCSKGSRRWHHNFWFHCQQIWRWNGRFTCTMYNGFDGQWFGIHYRLYLYHQNVQGFII